MAFLRFMSTPVGRTIRALAGIALVVTGVLLGGALGVGLALFGLAPFATGVLNVCPISPLVGEPFRGGPRPSSS